MAVEAIHRVGPSGHYLMDAHIPPRPPSEPGYVGGAGNKDTRARAIARVEELLRKHKSPGLPPEVDAAIRVSFNIL